MCQIMEDIREEGREEGRAEGRAEGEVNGGRKQALKTAKTMLELNKYNITEIVLLSGISIEEVTRLAEEMGRPLQ